LKESLAGQIVQQTLVALAYCHDHGVIHRDVKPANMMLSRSGWGDVLFKLVDFGLALQTKAATDLLGTPSYLAPEMASKQEYTEQADIWAVGVSAVELLTAQLPFGKPKDYGGSVGNLFEVVRKYRSLTDLEGRLGNVEKWKTRSQEVSLCIGRLLTPDPANRPPASQILTEPWLEKNKLKSVVLTKEMLNSLSGYVRAPPAVRCCLLAKAVRENLPEAEKLGGAFLTADVDGDGEISRSDLAIAVQASRNWWDPAVDTDQLVQDANLKHGVGLSFSEFVAACLFSQTPSLSDLFDDAFTALDADRDEFVSVEEIRLLFRERDAHVLEMLPQERPFSRAEWNNCFGKLILEQGSSVAPTAATRCNIFSWCGSGQGSDQGRCL
jgi:serine/threonine protein kinase